MKQNPYRNPSANEVDTKASAGGGKSPQAELAPGLYVTATPIGNARDITLRALDVLRNVDLIVAEDTRVTAKLLSIHAIEKSLSVYNDHNAARERPRILARLRGGARIALVSDAGTPLLSDPGFKLVREALAQGLKVHAVPGPSAALAGLIVGGLPTDRFLFAGFLPSRAGERKRMLGELKNTQATLIFFESTQRLLESLRDMSAIFGPRRAAVARELTKLHEEVRRDGLRDLVAIYEKGVAPKGEVTVVVAGAEERDADLSSLDPLLRSALEFMPLRAAVDLIAAACKVSRTSTYERALKLKSDVERQSP
jgi:16S rRNA (cytidine1402-2'-O)-methyltransferase